MAPAPGGAEVVSIAVLLVSGNLGGFLAFRQNGRDIAMGSDGRFGGKPNARPWSSILQGVDIFCWQSLVFLYARYDNRALACSFLDARTKATVNVGLECGLA